MASNAYVFLDDNPLTFRKDHSSYYFDRCNRQIVTSTGKEIDRVSLRRERDSVKIAHIGLTFEIDSRITKFSLDHKFLAVLKSAQQIDFINLETQLQLPQRCKRTNSTILDFFWTGLDTFFFVTTTGFELYQFSAKLTSTRLVKELKMPVKWFAYASKLLVLGSGPTQSSVNAFFFKGPSIIKIPKFELATGDGSTSKSKHVVKGKEITICRVYDRVYCIHHQVVRKQLHLYQMNKDSVSRSVVIDLHTEGMCAIHAYDNLLLCHNLQKKITLVFDIKEEESFVSAPLSMVAMNTSFEGEMYSEEWRYCQPNYIISPVQGLLWEVKIDIASAIMSFSSKRLIFDFLSRRSTTHSIIIEQLHLLLGERTSLAIVSRVFKQLNAILCANPDREEIVANESLVVDKYNSQMLTNALLSPKKTDDLPVNRKAPKGKNTVVITQADMHKEVFLHVDTPKMDSDYFVSCLVEYIRSLTHYRIEVGYFLYELIIKSLVADERFYKLHQFLQYHVIADSSPVAFQLFSIEQRYPPAGQLALDMLKRLRIDSSHIIEILLTRNRVLPALRVLRKSKRAPTHEEITLFLDTAAAAKDDILFYAVFTYFMEQKYVDTENMHFPMYEKKFFLSE